MSTSDRAESIRHRLRNHLRAAGQDMSLGLERYAAERFLFRLGRSEHRDRFILKGAALFAIWGVRYRPTRDLDFTGYGSPDADDMVQTVREICEVPDAVEGVVFDTSSIRAEPIRDGSEYDGLRIRLIARLGDSRIPLQVDIGFGNAIVPGPEEVEYRTLLGDPAPRILAYPQEAVVAEKLHALVTLGEQNSRYKDFYDLHALAAEFTFDLDTLARAARATFERRATPIQTGMPAALAASFYAHDGRAQQWRAYVGRTGVVGAPVDFAMVGDQVTGFLGPVWECLGPGRDAVGEWRDGGPWRVR